MIERQLSVTLIGLHRDKRPVLDFLQEQGILHITHVKDEDVAQDRPLKKVETISHALLELKWMEEQLQHFVKKLPKHKGFREKSLTEVLAEAKTIKQSLHQRLQKAVTTINKNKERISEAEKTLDFLTSIPFSFTKDTFPEQTGQVTFTALFRDPEEAVELAALLKQHVNIVKINGHTVVQGLVKEQEAVMQAIKGAGYQEIRLPEHIHDKQASISAARKTITKATTENAHLERMLSTIASNYLSVVVQTHHDLSIYHDRYEASQGFHATEHTFIIQGYVAKKHLSKLYNIEDVAQVHLNVEEVKEAPTQLAHLPYVKHYAFITKMFGYPPYDGVDPTFWISFFLPLFFGFMFSDVGYGALLVVMSLFLLLKSTTQTPILKDAGIVLFTCSLTTLLFGVLFGSFFGSLFGFTPVLFDPFSNAKIILIIALVVGLVHINLGVLIGLFLSLKRKAWKDFFAGHLSTLLLQAGIVLLALQQYWWGLGVLVVTALLFIVKSSLMGFMDITGFFGTWFSYARLLALSLATGGIALGINIIGAQLSGVAYLGPVLFVLILVIGHLFNFAMNVLGSSIHSVRLHYIEFFSQFYEGGGMPFHAFSTKRAKETL